jgi:hypothetical protein
MHMMSIGILLIVRGKIRHKSDRESWINVVRSSVRERSEAVIEIVLLNYLNFEVSGGLAVFLIVHPPCF